MATGTGTILELRLEPEGLGGQITCPPGLHPAPGQYLVAAGPDPGEALPAMLFPGGISAAGSTDAALGISPPLPPAWSVGMPLALRGPLGNGFHLPFTARRVALACLDGTISRLLPLVERALRQRAAVAIYAATIPGGLPEDVEVLPVDLLPEAPTWADFLALDTDRASLPDLRSRLGLAPFQRPACQVEVLVRTAMPCAGLAECGVCAVTTSKGWLHACTDGPVFDFHQLEGSKP